jgi:hypothetical protein
VKYLPALFASLVSAIVLLIGIVIIGVVGFVFLYALFGGLG